VTASTDPPDHAETSVDPGAGSPDALPGADTVQGERPEVLELDEAGVDALLLAERERVVVLYLRGPRCPNCEIFARFLPGILDELRGVPCVLAKCDVYAEPSLARRHGVHGIPHFIVYRSGKKLGRMSEFRGSEYFVGVVRDAAEGRLG